MTNPNPAPLSYQVHALTEVDQSHLNILAICYWIWGGIIALFSLFGLIYVAIGIAMVAGGLGAPTTQTAAPPPAFIGWMFIVMGAIATGIGQLTGWLNIVAGYSLKRHKRRILTMVTAGLNCISFPIGTTLGVFTFVVLARPSVRAAFAANEAAATSH